jgi:hypothetical protein
MRNHIHQMQREFDPADVHNDLNLIEDTDRPFDRICSRLHQVLKAVKR